MKNTDRIQHTSGAFLVWHYSRADWFMVARRLVRQAGNDNLSLMSAGIAFYAMLALFPALAAVIATYGFASDPVAIESTLNAVEPFLPGGAFGIVDQQVQVLIRAGTQSLGLASIVSLLLAVWGARSGLGAMISGLNIIYHENGSRGYFTDLLVAYVLTMLMILVAVVSVGAVVVIPTLLAFLPLGDYSGGVISLFSKATGVVTMLVGIGALYRLGPMPRQPRLPWLSPGSLMAVALWIAVSMLLSLYLRNFGQYNEIYGSLGAVIALLLWFYLSAYVVLLGAELNAALERHFVVVSRRKTRNGSVLTATD